jgi:predicted enzyme related to lactoylglutathione lyase
MARLRGPDFISLQVRDFAASRTFYTEMLGFKVDARFDAPDFVLFDTNSIPFALSAAKVDLNQTPQPGLGMTLWIDCDHVDELHAKLATAGVTILTSPFDGPFGRTFIFADPDGYRITANENPWDRFPLGGRKQD